MALRGNFLVLALFALLMPQAAVCQTHAWNLQAREHSQNLNSKALNFLQKPALKGSVDQAIAILNQAVQADPSDPDPLVTLGLAQDIKGNYQQAIQSLNAAFVLAPKSQEILLGIGLTHFANHDFKKAAAVLSELLAQDPQSGDANLNLGYCLLRLGDFDKARDSFKNAIAIKRNCQPALQGLALAAYFSGELEAANNAAEQAEAVHSYPAVTRLIAEIAYLRGDQTREKTAVQTINKLKSPYSQRSLAQLGFPTQHAFHWDPYQLDDFNNVSTVEALALDLPKEISKQRSLSSKGKFAAHIASAQSTLNAVPGDFYILRQLGLLNLAAGNYDQAISQFNQSIKLCQNCHVDYLYLGRALQLSGKQTEATQTVSEFVRHFSSQHLSPQLLSIANPAKQDQTSTIPAVGPGAGAPNATQPVGTGAGASTSATPPIVPVNTGF